MTVLLWRRRKDDNQLSPLPVGLSSPLSLAVAGIGLSAAIDVALSGFSVPGVPTSLAASLAAALGLGALGIFVGLYWIGAAHTGRAIEQAGHLLSASGWAASAITVAYFATDSPGLVPDVVQATALALGTLGRARALRRVNNVIEVAEASRAEW